MNEKETNIMKMRTKKMLSLLLAASMVFTMNTVAFAEEVPADEEIVAVDSVEEIVEVDEADVVEIAEESKSASGNSANAISADKVLSENLARINDILNQGKQTTISGADATYAIIYPTALPYTGQKVGSKKYPLESLVKVFKTDKKTVTASMNDALSDDNLAKAEGWEILDVKKVKVKAAKGATVDAEGNALFEVKKSTYIKSIQLKDSAANKAFNKDAEVKKYFKGEYSPKKVTDKVSDNDLTAKSNLVIAVEPAFAGNGEGTEAAIKADKATRDANATTLTTVALDFTKTKYKNELPKSIKATITDANNNTKKLTLKPTKKEGKYKGFVNKVEKNGDKTYVVADGNFFGNIYYTAK